MAFLSLNELKKLEQNITATIRVKATVMRHMFQKGNMTEVAKCSQEIASLKEKQVQISSQIQVITNTCATLTV